jgi:galactokinase
MPRAVAPGRVNLIGEHTDYNEGFVLPVAIHLHTSVDLEPRIDRRVTVASQGFGAASYRLGEERRARDWADHVRGVTWAIAESGLRIGGFDAHITSDVPPGAGLGSSAALSVALLRALDDAYGLDVNGIGLALLAQRGEREIVGANVGVMDQLAASLGRDDEALFIDTRSMDIRRIALPDEVALVVVDSGIAHQHSQGAYNAIREECARAASLLGLRALRDATVADARRLEPAHAELARRVRHVVSEDERVMEFVHALGAKDLVACGRLLDASHASLRDDYAVSLPEIDLLASSLREQEGVYGARLVGGGFGGSVLALAAPERAAKAAAQAVTAYVASTGHAARVLLE